MTYKQLTLKQRTEKWDRILHYEVKEYLLIARKRDLYVDQNNLLLLYQINDKRFTIKVHPSNIFKASRMRRYAEKLDWLYTSPL